MNNQHAEDGIIAIIREQYEQSQIEFYKAIAMLNAGHLEEGIRQTYHARGFAWDAWELSERVPDEQLGSLTTSHLLQVRDNLTRCAKQYEKIKSDIEGGA